MEKKTCSICQQEKLVSDFYSSLGRLRSACKKCECKKANDRHAKPEVRARRRQRLSAYRLKCANQVKPIDGIQECSACHEEKPLESFHKDKGVPSGRNTVCKVCVLARMKDRYYVNEWQIPANFVENKIKDQGGKCMICKKSKRLSLDHNHTTFALRDMLCSNCNTGIAYFCEDENTLRSAIAYLERHRLNPCEIKSHPRYQRRRDKAKSTASPPIPKVKREMVGGVSPQIRPAYSDLRTGPADAVHYLGLTKGRPSPRRASALD